MVMYDIAYETVYKKQTTLTHSCLLCYGNVSWVEFSELFLCFSGLGLFFSFLSELVQNRKVKLV